MFRKQRGDEIRWCWRRQQHLSPAPLHATRLELMEVTKGVGLLAPAPIPSGAERASGTVLFRELSKASDIGRSFRTTLPAAHFGIPNSAQGSAHLVLSGAKPLEAMDLLA